jgi:pimeloyl-ACP methyl ester carboxylesterase
VADDGVTQERVAVGERVLEVSLAGPEDGRPLVFHHGTPFPGVPPDDLLSAQHGRGLRTVAWARPGYAGSTAQPDRTVAAVAADAGAVLDHLGLEEFVTVGWSGGGPHALACATLLAGRCRGAAVLAGVGPTDTDDLDWTEGMGPENVEEFALARAGGEPYRAYLASAAEAMAAASPAEQAALVEGLLSPPDAALVAGPLAQWWTDSLQRGVSSGVEGWYEDDQAFMAPWGFDPAGTGVPVTLWQGTEDLMVPAAHGDWLARRLPDVAYHRLQGEGHVSLVVAHYDEILDELLSLAGWAP